jgi:anti-anti-sigma regulatory factor
MPIHIEKFETEGLTTLKVTGEMYIADAQVVEQVASEAAAAVIIDLADLHLLDGEAAAVLRSLGAREGVSLVGTERFLQHAIDTAERRPKK